jgi:Flp pilus assembly protein TadB
MILFGAAFGLGLALILRWAFPPAPTLAEALDALNRPPVKTSILTAEADGWASRLGAPMARFLAGANLPGAKISRDLIVLERAPQRHLAEKAVLAAGGLLFTPFIFTVLALLGTHLPWAVPVWGALGLAAAGFYLPDLSVKAEAQARRTEFRHALTAYLDLVVISLSGGAGIEAALAEAARAGDGWSFSAIRRALSAARLSRTAPWTTLRQLGDELDVPTLQELAATMALAGSEGAKVRASLASKAQSLRAQALADADAASQQATERMSLPVIAMFGGFLVFIAYPALAHVMTAL